MFRYYIEQIDSMLQCVCSVIDHRRRENVVRTSGTHSAIASCATFLFLPHFDIICVLLLNRRTATWYLFVKLLNNKAAFLASLKRAEDWQKTIEEDRLEGRNQKK